MNTFKSKMLLLILVILIVTTIVFMLVTQKEVERAILGAGEESARNMLHLVMLNVQNEYKSLLFHKQYALERYKQQLQNVVGIVASHIDSHYDMYQKGVLSKEDAKQLALESVEKFRYGYKDYFYIYNMDLYAISHPDPNIKGKDMSEYVDVKREFILQNIKKLLIKNGKGFNSFWHIRLGEEIPVEKLSYNLLYKNWNWIIGTGVYIDDIEADAEEKLNEIIEELKETFGKITIGETGYFFMFDGKKFMHIHPTLAGKDVSYLKDPITGSDHMQDLITASKNSDKPFEYLWDKPPVFENEFRFWKESYIDYFEPLDWYIASSVYKDEMKLPAKIIIRRQILMVLIILLISIIIVFILVKKFTKPLNKLTEHAIQLASSMSRRSVAKTDDFSPDASEGLMQLSEKSRDEMGKLAKAFIYMENTLHKYIKNLKETTAANEKIKSELRIAHDIQMGMIPKTFPAFPTRTEIDIFAFIEPAKDVGGDLYDYFFIDEENLCFLIGDVSDKGVPAALFMARSISLIRATTTFMKKNSRNEILPGTILDEVNKELYRDNEICMFVTLFMGILNTRTGKINYSNAGHNPSYLLRNNKIIQLEKICGCPLGIKKETNYKSYSFILEGYDCLFLYTDGITEAMDKDDNEFSEKRLEKYLESINGASLEEIISGIIKEVKDFSAGVHQSDDITVLALKYFGNDANDTTNRNNKIDISLKNDINEVSRLKQNLEEFAKHNNIEENTLFDLTLALEEIFINIILYAYEDKKEHQINICLGLEKDIILIEVKDDGKPFNPRKDTRIAFSDQHDDKKPGGKGFKLVKKLIDDMKYSRQKDINILTLKKFIKH